MAFKKTDLSALIAEAAEAEDHTQVVSTDDFSFDPPPAGVTVGRFIEYIEVGLHGQKPHKGKAKKDAEEVRVTFELLHPKKNIKEIEKEDGTKITIADRITVKLRKSLHEKASFRKLFDKMAYGRQDIKHFAQMLGEGFVITVYHNEVDKDGKKRTYANIQAEDGSWAVGAPVVVDPITETSKKVQIPEALSGLRMFLWNHPTQETWDSLFIDGDKEIKDAEGGVTTVSKNWIQNLIMKAKNFKGSPVEDMLNGAAVLDTADVEDAEESTEETDGLDALDALEETTEEVVEEVVEEAPAPKAAKPAAKPVAKPAAAKAPLTPVPAAKKTVAQVKPPVKAAAKPAPVKPAAPKLVAKTAAPAKAAPAKVKPKAVAPEEDPLAALGLV